MLKLLPPADGVNRPVIDVVEVNMVARELLAICDDMTSADLDLIDGTFLKRCVSWYNHWLRLTDEERRTTPVWSPVTGFHQLRLTDCSWWFHPPTEKQAAFHAIPPASFVHVLVRDRRWDGTMVEQYLRELVSRPGVREFSKLKTLPASSVLAPFYQLFTDDEDVSRPAAVLRATVFAHDSDNLLPPSGLIASTYDATLAATGWRNLMTGVDSKDTPLVTIRTWYVRLLMFAGSSFKDAHASWERVVGYRSTYTPQLGAQNLVALLKRVPEAYFLKEPKPGR